MTSDLILQDTGIDIVAQDVTLRRDDRDDSSIGVNLANKSGFWHISGPRSYDPGSPLAVFWNNLKDYVGPMLSIATDGRVRIGGNVTVDPKGQVGIGTDSPQSSLHVEGRGVHAGGSLGGYSFADRALTGPADDKAPGQRWVWYASQKIARLWSGGADQVTVSSGGALMAGGGVVVSNGTIYLPGLDDAPFAPRKPAGGHAQLVSDLGELFDHHGTIGQDGTVPKPVDVPRMIDRTDLCATIQSLQQRIDALEAEVTALKQPQPSHA